MALYSNPKYQVALLFRQGDKEATLWSGKPAPVSVHDESGGVTELSDFSDGPSSDGKDLADAHQGELPVLC